MQPDVPSDLSSRLIPLSTGTPGLRSTMHVEISKPDRDTSRGAASELRDNSCNSCLDFVSSDETLDRYDEIISASGWNLANYQRNPVFQNAHQYGDIIFTLGRAIITEVRQRGQSSSSSSSSSSNSELVVDRQSGLGPSAAQALDSRPSTLDSGQRSAGGFRRKYLEQELLEVSAVGIPANPNALALGLKSGAVEKGDVRDTYELLRLTLESSPSLNPQLIKLAARLYETLRKI
jgi:uncharacterized protein